MLAHPIGGCASLFIGFVLFSNVACRMHNFGFSTLLSLGSVALMASEVARGCWWPSTVAIGVTVALEVLSRAGFMGATEADVQQTFMTENGGYGTAHFRPGEEVPPAAQKRRTGRTNDVYTTPGGRTATVSKGVPESVRKELMRGLSALKFDTC